VPTVACAAVFLAARKCAHPLPDKWWELFDADWSDMWAVAGMVMRTYAPPTHAVRGMLAKADVRRWLEEHPGEGEA
jgi:hypothetical protein